MTTVLNGGVALGDASYDLLFHTKFCYVLPPEFSLAAAWLLWQLATSRHVSCMSYKRASSATSMLLNTSVADELCFTFLNLNSMGRITVSYVRWGW